MTPDSVQAAFMFIVWFVLGGGFSVSLVTFGLFLGYRYAVCRRMKYQYGIEFGRADLALAIVMVLGGIALLSAVLRAIGVYGEVLGG